MDTIVGIAIVAMTMMMTYVFVVVNLVTGRVIVIVTIKIDKIPEHTQQVFLRKKSRFYWQSSY